MQTTAVKKSLLGVALIAEYDHLKALKSEYLGMMQSIDDLPIPGRDVKAIRAERTATARARDIVASVPPKLGRKFRV